MTSAILSAVDEAQAIEDLHALGCTDGLPVIVPARERVERMVLATGLDPDDILGEMGPLMGAASVEKVATAAVMAGCLPDHIPVVVAAVRAMCKPEFDLREMQATTHCTAPLLIVNGPARTACGGIVSGFGVMGPGHRANASIGRAVRLAMINVGGARPGQSDMALHGHPGKFSFCIAEDEENSPFPPLHTTFGYDTEQSVVTVVGSEAPHSAFFIGDADDPHGSAEQLLAILASTVAAPGTNNVVLGGEGTVIMVMNPDHTAVLEAVGYDRAKVQQRIAELAVIPVEDARRFHPRQFAGFKGEYVKAVRDPERVMIVQAGGTGLYSMVMPTWSAGAHHNTAVHAEIELDQACEVPWATQS
ncbi:MAG: hypothetical protein GY724_23470 [Actinomycetia bacterium]|nr:hypothetical protein [Actinomycetes bacterium]MCP4225393.1 hypothetical protein [Actinomycetes bacterium]